MSNPNADIQSFRARWVNSRGIFMDDPGETEKLLKQANSEGRHLLAIEIAEGIIGGRSFEDAVPVKQQMARALSIMGSSEEALALVREIPGGRSDASETLGLLARVWKDLTVETDDAGERERCFRESLRHYSEGLALAEKSGDAGGGRILRDQCGGCRGVARGNGKRQGFRRESLRVCGWRWQLLRHRNPARGGADPRSRG